MGMIIQDGKQFYPVPEPPPRFWVLNPDVSQALHNSSKNNNAYTYVPYVFRANNGASSAQFKVNGTSSFNGNNICCVQRNGTEIGGAIFAIKIPKRTYKKLYVEVEVTAAQYTGWIKAFLRLCGSVSMHSGGYPADILPDIGATLVDYQSTSEIINSQPGVKINSTDPLLLSAQIVEIDVSDVNQDFYVGFYNCDRTITFRSIYLE